MTQQRNAHPRAIAMLMAAVALPTVPALAQEATTATPPVVSMVPPAAAPEATPAPQAQAAPAPTFAPASPVVQAIPEHSLPPVAAPANDTATAAPAPRAVKARPVTVARESRPAATAPAPVAKPALTPAPPVAAIPPAAEPTAPIEQPVATDTAPVATTPEPATETTTTQTQGNTTPWLLIGGGILALAALIFGFLSRGRRNRREQVAYAEPAYVAPTVVEPVAVHDLVMPVEPVRKPVIPTVAKQPAPVVAATGERPWIGLSLTPICAGATDDGTMVQYELTVDNASDVAAQDVRVSSFLIDGASSSEEELALMEPLGETQEQTVDIAANGSVPITTTIHVNRDELGGKAFEPKVVAEARYPLPGGGEGHFAARFAIGIADGDSIKAVGLTEKDGISEDVGAELDDVLERA